MRSESFGRKVWRNLRGPDGGEAGILSKRFTIQKWLTRLIFWRYRVFQVNVFQPLPFASRSRWTGFQLVGGLPTLPSENAGHDVDVWAPSLMVQGGVYLSVLRSSL